MEEPGGGKRPARNQALLLLAHPTTPPPFINQLPRQAARATRIDVGHPLRALLPFPYPATNERKDGAGGRRHPNRLNSGCYPE